MTENAPTYTAEELARIEEFEAPYLQKIAERGITQNDIDVLNAINQQVLVTKKQNKDYIMSLFNDEAFQGNSWQKRLDIWQDLLKESSHKPILGHGPQKNHFYDSQLYSENEYVLMLWRFGLVGLVVYLMIYLLKAVTLYFHTHLNYHLEKNLEIHNLFF